MPNWSSVCWSCVIVIRPGAAANCVVGSWTWVRKRVPAVSVVHAILVRHGLVDAEQSDKHRPCERFERKEPNDLWQMDYKGHFATDAGRCHPLTMLDDHSRFNLTLKACGDERNPTVKSALIAAFSVTACRVLCSRTTVAVGKLQSGESVDGTGRMAGAAGDHADSWPAFASADAGKRRAFSSHAHGRGAGHATLCRSRTGAGGVR